MPSPTFQTFDCFTQDLGRKVHNLNADVLKVVLTNIAPNRATNTVLSDITQIAAGGGYSTGGSPVTSNTWAQSGGVCPLLGTGPTFTASGGGFGPFQYAVLYNSTASGGPLIGFIDHGSSFSVAVPDGYQFVIDATNGVVKI